MEHSQFPLAALLSLELLPLCSLSNKLLKTLSLSLRELLIVCLWIPSLPGTAFANHLCLKKCLFWAGWSAQAAHQPVLNLCISLVPWWNIPSFWTFSIPHSVTNVLPFPRKCWVLKRVALPSWCSGVSQTKCNQLVWMSFWVVWMLHFPIFTELCYPWEPSAVSHAGLVSFPHCQILQQEMNNKKIMRVSKCFPAGDNKAVLFLSQTVPPDQGRI